MKTLPQILAIVLLINALVATFFHSWVYDELDSYLYEQLNQQLIDVKSVTDKTLHNIDATQWQQKAMELGIQFETQATVEQIKTLDIDLSVLAQIKPGQGTIIDDTMPMLYFALDKEQVMVIGPITTGTGLGYFTEWISWLAGMVVSTAIMAFIFLQRQTEWKKFREVLSLFPGMEDQCKDQDIESILAKLRHSQVKQSQEHHERLTSQRDLLHGVAHEFRSPMARMQFALDMLTDCSEEEREELVTKIEKSLGDLDELVKELLYYSRLKHEQDPIHLTWLSLNEIIPQSIEVVKPFYPGIRFELDVEEQSMIQADKALVKRLLINILRNAGRFSDQLCRVSTRITEYSVEVCIEDDGPGIPPGKADRIFEPFTRLDPSRSRDSGGCGLGLAIVASIVNKHQATIDVDNGELGGASFRLKFPR